MFSRHLFNSQALADEVRVRDSEETTTGDYFSRPLRRQTDLVSNKSATDLGKHLTHISGCPRSMSFDASISQNPLRQKFNSRKPSMRLPSLPGLEMSKDIRELLVSGLAMSNRARSSGSINSLPIVEATTVCSGQANTSGSSVSTPTSLDVSIGVVPLLTPPTEVECSQWASLGQAKTNLFSNSGSATLANNEIVVSNQQTTTTAMTTRPTEISLPAYVAPPDNNNHSSTWLERANQTIISSLNEKAHATQVQMIVQALPSQSKNVDSKPVFQELVERIQQQHNDVPYITITHAVSQVMSMEEVPASPPATPNIMHHSDSYFENHTIFTHAAMVPTYHNKPFAAKLMCHRPTSIIAAPSSIDISILERYIPPTSVEEVRDFFSISRRSYLVDRLTELSADNGAMLLIYPTQKGGSTFAKRYIGPVLDPFLRRFVLLNDMTYDAASALGRMASLSEMADFDALKTQLVELCEGLTQRAPSRGIRSAYNVLHAETTEVTIDRTTWLEWYLEQEHGRLRQDLVDYEKAGGRMPQRGFHATPGALAREVVDGIRESDEVAGGVGIEIGIFVIRRSLM